MNPVKIQLRHEIVDRLKIEVRRHIPEFTRVTERIWKQVRNPVWNQVDDQLVSQVREGLE